MPNDQLRQRAQQLAPNCLLYDEFLIREIEAGRIDPSVFRHLTQDIWLHGHCHQKALVGIDKTAQLLRYATSGTVHVIPSGCCGMAGSFGYDKDHYATSISIGEMTLFPTIRANIKQPTGQITNDQMVNDKMVNDLVSAPGTSCREHILHGTGIKPLHPIQVLFDGLSN